MAGPTTRIHPGKRKADPMMTRNGKPRLGSLNIKQLEELKEKSQQKKNKAKITREIARRLVLQVV
jgi:hypothetical protein